MRFLQPCPRRKSRPLFSIELYFQNLSSKLNAPFFWVVYRLGVGAPLPEKAADGSWNRTELSSNDALRKQLLGRNYDKFMKAKQAAAKGGVSALARKTAASGSGSAAAGDDKDNEEEEEEEEGRVSMVGKKRGRRREIGPASDAGASAPAAADATTAGNAEDASGKAGSGTVETGATATATARPAPAKGRKKATSYLDELLAERSKKRKKR